MGWDDELEKTGLETMTELEFEEYKRSILDTSGMEPEENFLPFIDENDTTYLRQEVARLRAMIEHGTHCGACGRHTKGNVRTINRTMAICLQTMVELSGTDGIFLETKTLGNYFTATNQFQTLIYWGLIEPMTKNGEPWVPGSEKVVGWWRPTPKGISFSQGKCTVEKFVAVFNSKLLKRYGDPWGIWDSLEQSYSYYL